MKRMKKMGMIRQVIFSMLLVIAGLISCSGTEEWWDSERNVGWVVGIVNDSLALRTSHRTFHSQTGGAMFGMISADASESYIVKNHGGLHLVNYRSKQPVVWSDTVNWETNIIGQVTDSMVYGGDLWNEIVLWKIGEKPKKIKPKWSGNCAFRLRKSSIPDFRVRPWRDGKFLLLGKTPTNQLRADTCQYAILDTSTSEAVLSRFNSEEEAWLSECRDIRYSNNQIICLQSAGGQIDTVVNAELSDSKNINGNLEFTELWGNYIKVDEPSFTDFILNLENLKFNENYSTIWIYTSPLNRYFVDSLGNEILYTSEEFSHLESNR